MRKGTFLNSESNPDLGHKLVARQVSRHYGLPIRDERVHASWGNPCLFSESIDGILPSACCLLRKADQLSAALPR